MAASFVLKRAKVFELFSARFLSRTFCTATASCEDNLMQDVAPKNKEKKKDLAKIATYEEYRTNVKNIRKHFKGEYKVMRAEEKRRLDEINQGMFSGFEQHQKAVEDITKYNTQKEDARKIKDNEKERRIQVYSQKQKEASDAKELEKKREKVLKLIDESKSFVTFENLEEKIQEVLSKETNYNFAITTDRRKLVSKEPPNNLGMQGPGPLAYQGQRMFNKDTQDSWKTRRKLTNKVEESDSSDSSDSDSSSDDDK